MAVFAFELDHCDDPIVYEHMSQRLTDIDLELAQSVAELVGGTKPSKATRINHGKKAKNLSQTEVQPTKPTIATHRVATIIADGFDKTVYDAITSTLKASGALPFTIASRRSEIFSAGVEKKPGNGIKPNRHLEGRRSTLFDAIFTPGDADSIKTPEKSGRAIYWLREAFGHLKAIGATGEAVQLLEQVITLPEVKMSSDDKNR